MFPVHKVATLTVMGKYDKKDSLRGPARPTKTANQNKGFAKLPHYPNLFVTIKIFSKKKEKFYRQKIRPYCYLFNEIMQFNKFKNMIKYRNENSSTLAKLHITNYK